MEGWPSWLPGVNPGARRAGHQATNQITWFLMGLGELWLSYARGRKGPECLDWVPLGPCPHPHTTTTTTTTKSLQSCPTLCDPTDGSPPGSTVPGILQARTLEWVAIAFSNA